jgi:type III secretory pathway component EscT
MSLETLALALARALPLCLVLPLPGWPPRLALALVLGWSAPLGSAAPDGALPVEIARGLALGLGLGLPVWAARAATRALGLVAAREHAIFDWSAAALAWSLFCAFGGATLLCGAYLGSYAAWPLGGPTPLGEAHGLALLESGRGAFALFARLALPGLLAVALLELCTGLLARLEGAARAPLGAARLGQALRPIIALVLFSGSLAALVAGLNTLR